MYTVGVGAGELAAREPRKEEKATRVDGRDDGQGLQREEGLGKKKGGGGEEGAREHLIGELGTKVGKKSDRIS
jgi:hypothetical protein